MRCALVIVAVLGCGGEEAAYRDAIGEVCSGTFADHGSGKLVAKLWQTQGLREDLRAFASAPPRERGTRLSAILGRAGVTQCNGRTLADIERSTYFGVELAPVAGPALRKAATDVPAIRVTPTAIVGDHAELALVQNGTVDSRAKEGGALGVKIERVASYMTVFAKEHGPDALVPIAIDRNMTYRTLIETVYSIQQAGLRKFALLVDAGAHVAAIDVTLPDKQGPVPAPVMDRPPTEQPLHMVISVTRQHALVWSMSRREGSYQSPRAMFPVTAGALAPAELANLRALLVDLRTRYWGPGGRPRSDADRAIILQLDGRVGTETLLQLAATVMHDDKGAPLFPDIQLSTAFE